MSSGRSKAFHQILTVWKFQGEASTTLTSASMQQRLVVFATSHAALSPLLPPGYMSECHLGHDFIRPSFLASCSHMLCPCIQTEAIWDLSYAVRLQQLQDSDRPTPAARDPARQPSTQRHPFQSEKNDSKLFQCEDKDSALLALNMVARRRYVLRWD